MEITPVSGVIVQVSCTMVSKVLRVLYPECGILHVNGIPRVITNTVLNLIKLKFYLKNACFSGKCRQSRLMKTHKMLISYVKLDHTLYLIKYGSMFLQDLLDNGVEIELMHIGSRFDVSKFYQVLYVYCSCIIVHIHIVMTFCNLSPLCFVTIPFRRL